MDWLVFALSIFFTLFESIYSIYWIHRSSTVTEQTQNPLEVTKGLGFFGVMIKLTYSQLILLSICQIPVVYRYFTEGYGPKFMDNFSKYIKYSFNGTFTAFVSLYLLTLALSFYQYNDSYLAGMQGSYELVKQYMIMNVGMIAILGLFIAFFRNLQNKTHNSGNGKIHFLVGNQKIEPNRELIQGIPVYGI